MGSPNMLDDKIRKTLARNLKALLERSEMSQYALAQKTKHMSQKAINNVAEARTGCGVDALVEIGSVLSVPPWILLYEHLDDVLPNTSQFVALVDAYARASAETRDLISTVARKVK